MPSPRFFMNLRLRFTKKAELLADIDQATITKPCRVATANPEFILEASHNPAFRQALEKMTHVTVDGTGLEIALTLFSPYSTSLYHGSDLAQDLFARYQHGEKSFYFLGGKPENAALAATQVRQRYPNIKIIGAEDGGRLDHQNPIIDLALTHHLTEAMPDILLVGFGAPKQELWIQAATEFPIPVMIGIGGTLDFYTIKKRAPKMIRELHFEWLYRTFTEKGHWRRSFRAFVIFAPYSFIWWLTHLRLAYQDTGKKD